MTEVRAPSRLLFRFGLPAVGVMASAIYAGIPHDSAACTCACSASPEEELAAYDLVFYGRVIDVREAIGCGPREIVEFEVLEGFRGTETGDRVGVSATGRGGGDCGLANAFAVGDELILFTDSHSPSVSLCSAYVRAPDGSYNSCSTGDSADPGVLTFDEVLAALEAASD